MHSFLTHSSYESDSGMNLFHSKMAVNWKMEEVSPPTMHPGLPPPTVILGLLAPNLVMEVAYPLGKLSGVGNGGGEKHIVDVIRKQNYSLLPHHAPL